MADVPYHHTGHTFMRRIRLNPPNSTTILGFLTALVSGGCLLLLMALTLTGSVTSLILLTPALILFSPILVPVGLGLMVSTAGFLAAGGMGVAGVWALSWVYRYSRGHNPAGSVKIDYVRIRLAEAANQLKMQARDYAGYLQHKIHKAAPGA